MFQSVWFDSYFTAFFSLFVIMDAFGALPLFLMLSEKIPKAKRAKAANNTLLVAAILLLIFIFGGSAILNYFGISIPSFQVAGGLILLIIGLKIVLGLKLGAQQKHVELYEFTAVPMATPLIVGPGTITTTIILVAQYGYVLVALAALLNLIVMWIVLRNAFFIYRFLGHQGVEIISRIVGIILTALAVEFIHEGLVALLSGSSL
ncbi:MAG: MarC family protein [Candidatus Gracilibacteria bacterium]